MDNENKIDALNVSEEAKRTADIDRAAAFQYHSPLSPAPPSYPPVQGGGSTLKGRGVSGFSLWLFWHWLCWHLYQA